MIMQDRTCSRTFILKTTEYQYTATINKEDSLL